MKKKIAMKWVKALRSGDYKQGRGKLRDTENKFCCLGVLCNLHAIANPKLAKGQTCELSYFGKKEFPPGEVLNWSGLQSDNPEFKSKNHKVMSLIDMNDSGSYSFKKIANYIEKYYDQL